MKKKKSIYETKYWYMNTYKSLGSNWLIKSIEALNPPNNYVFINLSANAGYYEKDVYETHLKQYDPTYYIGDMESSKLKDVKTDSFKDFHYIDGDNNAVTFDVSKIPNKADILMDCKGALWHILEKVDKKQLIQLLENYAAMINESGVLLLDYYCINYLRFYYQNLKWSFKRYNKRQTIVDCFGETSTYYYLVNLYGKQTIDMLLIPLSIKEQIPYLPLSKIMDTAYISANDLNKLIEITKNTPKWRFAFAKCKNHIKAILLSLCSRLRYFYSWFFFLILDCIFMFNIIAA